MSGGVWSIVVQLRVAGVERQLDRPHGRDPHLVEQRHYARRDVRGQREAGFEPEECPEVGDGAFPVPHPETCPRPQLEGVDERGAAGRVAKRLRLQDCDGTVEHRQRLLVFQRVEQTTSLDELGRFLRNRRGRQQQHRQQKQAAHRRGDPQPQRHRQVCPTDR